MYEDDSYSLAYQEDGYGVTHFKINQRDGAVVLSGTPTEGKSFGETREVQLRVAVPVAPIKIMFNGAEISGDKIAFDASARRATVDLGILPVSLGWEVVVTL